MTVDLSKGLLNPGVKVIHDKLTEMGWLPIQTSRHAGYNTNPPPLPAHKLNADQTVAVATDVFWNEDMTTCPRGAKVQLLGAGGVAVYGDYHGDTFWQAWAPLPKRRKPTSSKHP